MILKDHRTSAGTARDHSFPPVNVIDMKATILLPDHSFVVNVVKASRNMIYASFKRNLAVLLIINQLPPNMQDLGFKKMSV